MFFSKKYFHQIGVGPTCWIDCRNTLYSFECGVLCTDNEKQCGLVLAGAFGSGLGMTSALLVSPIEISGSLYASLASGLVGTTASSAFFSAYFLFDSCSPK